jgi:hypothetical protein
MVKRTANDRAACVVRYVIAFRNGTGTAGNRGFRSEITHGVMVSPIVEPKR